MTDKKIPASSPRRRLLLQGSAAFAAGLAVHAFVRAQGSSPIRIGHLTPRTGFLGPMGEYAVLGATMAGEEVNAAGGVLGRNVELLTEDSGNPQTASTQPHAIAYNNTASAMGGEIRSGYG